MRGSVGGFRSRTTMGDYNNGAAIENGQKVEYRVNGSNGETIMEDALVNLMDRTGYTMVQENGQRKFGGPPPRWSGPPPIKGSEIFVGKIPRDVFEDELFPLFQQIGKIYEMRLMMDFSGSNRGYAFVTYTNPEDAKKAISQMNNYQIRPGKYLGVVKSVDNCRLFVGFIPKTKTKEEIREEISKVTEGVVDVILYNSPKDKTKNRGFAFVEYDSHRAAAIARRKLLPGRIMLWNQQIQVDWAEPEPEVDEDIMATVKVLYVRNLMETTTEETLKKVFEGGRPRSVEKVKKLRDFAFIHFIAREEADEAKDRLNNTDLEGSEIVVMWAKPIDRSSNRLATRRGQFNNHGYHNTSPMRYTVPYSAGIDSPSVPFGVAQGGHIIAYQPPGPGSRGGGGGLFGGKALSPKGRGRGAAGMRGGRGYYGAGSRHTEFRFFDMPQGISFLPTNPMPIMRPLKAPYQILAEFCQKHSFGEPQYQMLPCVGTHAEGPNVQLFQCKVVIPNWGDYTTPRPLRSADEAKIYAAQGALSQMSTPWEDRGSSECSSLSPVHSASPNAYNRSPAVQSANSSALCSIINEEYVGRSFQSSANRQALTRNELSAFFELPQSAAMYAMTGSPGVGPAGNF